MKKASLISSFQVLMIVIFGCIVVYSIIELLCSGADMHTLKEAERKESLSTSSPAELFFCIFYHPILSNK